MGDLGCRVPTAGDVDCPTCSCSTNKNDDTPPWQPGDVTPLGTRVFVDGDLIHQSINDLLFNRQVSRLHWSVGGLEMGANRGGG